MNKGQIRRSRAAGVQRGRYIANWARFTAQSIATAFPIEVDGVLIAAKEMAKAMKWGEMQELLAAEYGDLADLVALLTAKADEYEASAKQAESFIDRGSMLPPLVEEPVVQAPGKRYKTRPVHNGIAFVLHE